MTAVLPVPVSPGDVVAKRPTRQARVLVVTETAAIVVLLLVWSRVIAAGQGGREPHVLVFGLIAAFFAVLAVRPWRTVPTAALIGAAAIPMSAALVCVFSPEGWGGAGTIGTWAYAAATFVVFAGFARTPARASVAAAAIVLVGFDQFAQGWLAWWGGADPTKPMNGTMGYYNQFGGFLAPVFVMAAAATTSKDRLVRLIGWVAGPFVGAGIVFSTSRGSAVAAAVGVLVLLVVLGVRQDRAGALLRVAGLGALTIGIVFVLTGPPVFAHRAVPLAGIQQRSAVDSGSASSGYRLDFMRAAVGEFTDRPFTGGGFGSFAEASPQHLPYGFTTLSPYAHNGYAQALSDGGLLFGGPVLLASLFLMIAACRLVRRTAQGGSAAGTWAAAGACGGLFATIAHSAVDFDWAWPAVLAMTGALAGLVVAGLHRSGVREGPGAGPAADAMPMRPPTRVPAAAADASPEGCAQVKTFPVGVSRALRPTAIVALLAFVVAGTGGVLLQDDTNERLRQVRFTKAGSDPAQVTVLLHGARLPVSDPRLDRQLVASAARFGIGPGKFDPAVIREALNGGSARIGEVDSVHRMDRALVLAALGDPSGAVAEAKDNYDTNGALRPGLTAGYAQVLYKVGRRDEATRLLTGRLSRLLTEVVQYRTGPGLVTRPTPESLIRVLFAGTGVGSPESSCAYRHLLDAFPESRNQPIPVGLVPAPTGCLL